MVQRHNVYIPTEAGGVEVYPMKEWLRQHPDQNPSGLDPSITTSHQLRIAMLKAGWTKQETPTEYKLFTPDSEGKAEITEIIGAPSDEAEAGEGSPYFSLEYQLRDFIASNLDVVAINGRRLRLFVDATGRDGIEYPSAVGPIDILAVDDAGAFFVFELKRANSPDSAMGQVARYMGWVKQTVGRDKDVHGIIVARTISERLKYARAVVPNVYLFEYEVSFSLRPAHDFPAGQV